MNRKPHLINLQAILNNRGFNVLCHAPYVEKSSDQECKQQIGMNFLYLKDGQAQNEELERFLEEASYIEMVSPKEEAA